MKTFKQFLEEQKADQIYGWFNPKGSFVRNRKGNIHGDTYSQMTGDTKGDYWSKIDRATKKGWQRVAIEKDDGMKGLYGVIQGDKKKWTDRHSRGLKLAKKAIGAVGYRSLIDKVPE